MLPRTSPRQPLHPLSRLPTLPHPVRPGIGQVHWCPQHRNLSLHRRTRHSLRLLPLWMKSTLCERRCWRRSTRSQVSLQPRGVKEMHQSSGVAMAPQRSCHHTPLPRMQPPRSQSWFGQRWGESWTTRRRAGTSVASSPACALTEPESRVRHRTCTADSRSVRVLAPCLLALELAPGLVQVLLVAPHVWPRLHQGESPSTHLRFASRTCCSPWAVSPLEAELACAIQLRAGKSSSQVPTCYVVSGVRVLWVGPPLVVATPALCNDATMRSSW